ncbi:acyl-CoA synthetase (NDP forming) [Stella humosa]|uniref:Acyl-CoA synthetase (NDP forming) n=1 Tax=Stella humosa TaxID=94 RepID=A0A3N1KW72_9PROT|nr:acetate--CoA ligase family protein [Stella humosa]ROP83069.1 acyl-CoA synthetase (NDP forming) [Stella humosa]BBK30156.1 pimeloyl-CoA synthetase [Stella humosa]
MSDAPTAAAGMPLLDPASLEGMLRPRSVAIVGASNDPTRIGGRPLRYYLENGFTGAIYPINPNRDEIQGVKAYPNLSSLPEAPDLVLVAIPASGVVATAEEAAAKGVRAMVIFSSGFAEVEGGEGQAMQDRLTEIAQASGMRIAGPNCLGVFNATMGHYCTFTASFDLGGFPIPGGIAIVSQSGAYGSHMATLAREKGLGTTYWVTTGNECDVQVADCIAFLADQPDVDVIGCYIEGVVNADRLTAALDHAYQRRKPVVVMKVGRSAVGAEAAQSHTASLAGADRVYDSVFRRHGVLRVDTTEEMLDVAYACTRRTFPTGRKLGIVTISGGGGVVLADAATAAGLEVPAMPADAQRRLKELLPFAAVRNPVDITAQAFNDMSLVTKNVETMLEEGGYDFIINFFTSIPRSKVLNARLRPAMQEAQRRFPGRLQVMCMISTPEMTKEYESDGYLVFEDPHRAVKALAALCYYGEAFGRPPRAAPPAVPAGALPAPDGAVDERAAKRILAAAGIPVVEDRLVRTPEEARNAAAAFGGPVVLKISSPDIQHKTEVGGVAVGLASPEDVAVAFAAMSARVSAARPAARIEGALVSPMIADGVECIMGITVDPAFGPVVLFGLGGIFVEVLKDIALRVAPFGLDEAEAMIREVKGFPLLDGARGKPKADVAALAQALSRLSVFAAANADRIDSVDVNPILVRPAGRGVVAVDALFVPRQS